VTGAGVPELLEAAWRVLREARLADRDNADGSQDPALSIRE